MPSSQNIFISTWGKVTNSHCQPILVTITLPCCIFFILIEIYLLVYLFISSFSLLECNFYEGRNLIISPKYVQCLEKFLVHSSHLLNKCQGSLLSNDYTPHWLDIFSLTKSTVKKIMYQYFIYKYLNCFLNSLVSIFAFAFLQKIGKSDNFE